MHISLRPELEEFVAAQVKVGGYASADEVLEAAVARLMLDPEPQELDAETLAALEEGEAQLDRGEGISLEEAFDALRKKFPR